MAKHNSDPKCVKTWGVCDIRSAVASTADNERELPHVCSEPIPHNPHVCMACGIPQTW